MIVIGKRTICSGRHIHVAYELKIIKDKELANIIFTQGSLTGDTNSKNYTQKHFDKSWPTYLVFMVLYDGKDPIAFSGAKDYGKFARIFDRWFVFPEYRQCGLGDNEWCKQFIIPLMDNIGDKIPFISMEFARRKPALEKAVKAWNNVLPKEKHLRVLDGLYETVPNSWQNIALPKSEPGIDLPYQSDIRFKTVEPGKVWVCDDFLSDKEMEHILEEWNKFNDWTTIEQEKNKAYVSDIHYSYEKPKIQPVYKHKSRIVRNVLDRLNPLYKREFGEAAENQWTHMRKNQFYFKEHEPGVSRFDLHAEPTPNDKDTFGHCVFMLYLTDEADGAIICPSEADAERDGLITDSYIAGVEGITIDWCKNTVKTLPKVNRCIVMKTGTPHYVPTCSGRRKCISGWSFMDDLPPLKIKHDE